MPRKPTAKPALARFANLLAKHLADGTRPGMAAGEPWTYAAFAAEVTSSRENDFVSPRSVSNWCKGSALPEEIEPILRALFGPATSGRHAEARTALRKAFQAARAGRNGAVIARAKPDPAGPRWVVEGDQLVIDRTERPTDRRAARDPLRQQLQVAIREFSAALAERAKRLSNSPIWGDLPVTAAAFHAVVDADPLRMPEQLGIAYARLLRLGRFLETNSQVRNDPTQEHDPLDPDIHGLLTDLVRTAAPWLRGFPTVAAWDDAAGKALVRANLFQPARDFARIACKQQAISERDAAEMELLAATSDTEDYLGRKAGDRAVGGARNLMLAAAMLVAAASLEPAPMGAGSRPLVTRRAGRTLAEGRTEIEALVATLPDDLRNALRALVEEGRQLDELFSLRAPSPVHPSVPEDVEAQARAMILEGHAPPSVWRPFIHSLDLSFTMLKSLAPLSGLNALRYLDLWSTKVSDLAPLTQLTNLQHLDLTGTQVSDLTSLSESTDLRHLDLRRTQVTNLAPLAELTALEYLNLAFTDVSDVASLSGLTALRLLDLYGTRVSNVVPLAGLRALQYLDLGGTQVSDVASLLQLTLLQHLDLVGTRVKQLPPALAEQLKDKLRK